MKRTDRVELEALLHDPAPHPPEELCQAILGELPAELPVGGSGGGRNWPRWALAATLATAVIGGWTVRELRQHGESTGTSAMPPPAAAPAAAPAPGRESAPSGAPAAAPAAAPETVPNVARAVTERAPRNDGRARVEESPALQEFRRGAASSEPASGETAAGGETQTQDVVGEAVADSRRHDAGRLAVPSSSAAKVRAPAATPPHSDALTRQAEPVQAAEVPPKRFEESVLVVGEAELFDERRIAASSSVAGVRANPSTGGTREPNDRLYGDVFFQEYGTNPFVDAEEDPLSTFGLDVDTASYAVARRYLADGHLPPSEAVRVEEFVNAVPAMPGRARGSRDKGGLRLDVEGAPTPFATALPERYRILRFTVSAAEATRLRRPVVLTFVVDTSGSMEREDRLGLVRRSLGLLLDELEPEDRVGLVVYDDRARVLCEPTRDRERLRRELDGLRPGGSTNAEEGLALGYEVADRAYVRGAINRVLLASDGVANVGATGPQSILERIGAAARHGIYLTTVGFGMGNYNDVLMEQLADRGDGQYAYVDTLEEARRIFRDNLGATLDTVARDAKAQVEFNPDAVERYRLLGYENRDIADRKFRDDRIDAGEIGAGHVVTALYEVKLRPGAERRGGTLATLRVRYRDVRDGADGEIVERSRKLAGGDLARSWDDASVGLRWAGCAAQFAELLKQTYWAKDDAWPDLLRAARPLARQVGGEGRDQAREFADLVERAARLVEGRGALEER